MLRLPVGRCATASSSFFYKPVTDCTATATAIGDCVFSLGVGGGGEKCARVAFPESLTPANGKALIVTALAAASSSTSSFSPITQGLGIYLEPLFFFFGCSSCSENCQESKVLHFFSCHTLGLLLVPLPTRPGGAPRSSEAVESLLWKCSRRKD